jgi:hypothetical protein
MTLAAKQPPVIALSDRRALTRWRPAPAETIAQAVRLKDAALLDFGMTNSAIASWLYAKCRHQVPTTAVETACVVASGDGACLLAFNPEFFTRLGLDGVKFVLFHEARHLIQRHLHVDEAMRADPVFELAAEVTINHVALLRLGHEGLPELEGVPVGVDPRKVHGMYVADLAAQGLDSVEYEAFVATDLTTYGELKRMATPPVAAAPCVHQSTRLQLDQETVDTVVESVLLNCLLSARRGHPAAGAELTDLMGRTEDDAAARRTWGKLGAGALRGQTDATRRVEWWQRWLIDVLGSKLNEGERLVYPKKRGAILAALGQDPLLSRSGPIRTKVVVVALDTSGSMPAGVITWLTDLVGRIDGVEAHWLSFDGVVMPFKAGERVYGGGGTSFQAVADYIEGRTQVHGAFFDARPDAVIMLTDGYAPKITPAEPDKWIWLITPNGSDWPEHHQPQMACHRVSNGEDRA